LDHHVDEKDEANDDRERRDSVHDPPMRWTNHDAQQEDGDGYFAENGRDGIANVAEEPVLETSARSESELLRIVQTSIARALCSGVKSTRCFPVPQREPPIMHPENMT
jgi:hypothetical protein